MSNYYDLGAYTRKVTTTSSDAQCWFVRGLNWCYGFNHEEAIVCFEKALEHDPDCAMAHWGIAYAIGPNYNKPWEAFDEEDKRKEAAKANADVRWPSDVNKGRPLSDSEKWGRSRTEKADGKDGFDRDFGDDPEGLRG